VGSSPACAGEPHADRPATLRFFALKPHKRNVAHEVQRYTRLEDYKRNVAHEVQRYTRYNISSIMLFPV